MNPRIGAPANDRFSAPAGLVWVLVVVGCGIDGAGLGVAELARPEPDAGLRPEVFVSPDDVPGPGSAPDDKHLDAGPEVPELADARPPQLAPDVPPAPAWPRCSPEVQRASQACQTGGNRHRTAEGLICDVCEGAGPRPCWTTAGELAIPACAPAALVLCVASCSTATSCTPSGGKACD